MWLIGPLFVFLFWSTNIFAYGNARTQFNLLLGTDNPQEGEERDSNASMLKFGITTRPQNIFRFGASFNYVTGGGLQQGEFACGPFVFPFAKNGRAPVQPFLFGEATLGVGTYDEKLRTDTGGGFGVGADFRVAKKWGISLVIEQHLATESSQRLFLGFHFLKD